MRTSNSKRWVSVKNGSYWRTGLPLLLKTVQPLPTQRGLTSFGVISRLAVRAHDDLARGVARGNGSGLGLDLLLDLAAEAVGVGEADLDPAVRWSGAGSLAWVSRASVAATAGGFFAGSGSRQ